MAGGLLFLGFLSWRAARDPRIVFLAGDGAPWIAPNRAPELKAGLAMPSFARFRLRFRLKDWQPRESPLILRARSESQVVLDGKEALPPAEAPGGWKSPRLGLLRAGPGPHELLVVVRAAPGPPALSLAATGWELYTGQSWEYLAASGAWVRAREATVAGEMPWFAGRPRAFPSLLRTLPFLLPTVLLGALLSGRGLSRPWLWAGGAWCLTAAVGWARLPAGAGFDAEQHLELVRLIARGGLPGPGESWQSFQAPLYHILAIPLAWAGRLFSDEAALKLLRLPNLACGFLLARLCAAFAREARPGRPEAPAAAGLFALALAPNLYMSQTPGNEPLSAALTAAFLLLALREGRAATGPRGGALLGAAAGAALLAKTTAVLALPAGLLLAAGGRGRARRSGAASGRRAEAAWWGALVAAALFAGGWWYLRNLVLRGALFTGGWDSARGIAWAQDPGFRTAESFLRFGRVFGQPVYAGLAGFWDALYSTLWLDGWQMGLVNPEAAPPWRPAWQAAAAAWGLVPSALLARGAWRALWEDNDAPSGAALLALATGLAALLWMFLAVPVYSTVKAGYLLGLAPAAGLLLSDGLPEGGRSRAAAWGLLSGWAACSWLAHLAA